MKPNEVRLRSRRLLRGFLPAFLSAGFLVAAGAAGAQEKAAAPAPAATPSAAAKPDTSAAKTAAPIPPQQLESLVAPIALYPDDLLAQTLVAATYPLEIVQLQQWMEKHKDLKDKALADSVAKQNWDPSIQSMAAVPDVVNRLANDIQWTTDLGNAFLAQQADVMDAVQRMRKKAMDKGALASNEQQKVDTLIVEQKTVIVVESTNPEVIYVPSYSPAVVYGPPPYAYYPYPPIYYPPYPPGAAFVSFSMGVMWGAAVWGGSCCGCGWGGNDVNINVDNNFNQINHNRGDGNRGQGGDRGQGGRGQGGSGGKWQHDASHRGAAPYGDKATASKYGGSARGESRGQAGASNRASTGVSNQGRGTSGGAGVSNQGRGTGSDRSGRASAGSPSASNRGSSSGSRGGDQIGSRNIPKSGSKSSQSGFSGGSRGYSGSSARASSSRGSASRGGGSRGGGGGGRGGGRR